MKSFLEQYETTTRYLLAGSLALTALGIYLYQSWPMLGGLICALSGLGLIWCFLRR